MSFVENQSGKDINALNPSVDKSVVSQATDFGCENWSCTPQSNSTQPSLMERNSTAHAYEVPVLMFCYFNLRNMLHVDNVQFLIRTCL